MSLEETVDKIVTMEIRGAGKIGRAAAEALKDYAKQLSEKDPKKFLRAMISARETLQSTRPTAVSLENALDTVMKGAQGETVDQIRDGVIIAADLFISRSRAAVDAIADMCATKIYPGNTIMTHCNSSVVVSGIIKAHEQKKKIKVFATETRPWGQGYITAQELAGAGVEVTLIVDSAARRFMAETDIVLIGADTITATGTVINKIGTSLIALCARERRVPVYVCAESYKFSKATMKGNFVEIEERDIGEIVEPDKLNGVKLRNPVFDETPPDYIDAIITEHGILSPHAAYNIIKN